MPVTYEAYTAASLIQLMSQRFLGDWRSGTATGGAAGGTTITTTSLREVAAENYVAMFAEMTSGSSNGDIRQISDASVASGVLTLTVINAFTAQIANTETFRVHRFQPAWKLEAVDEALRHIGTYVPYAFQEALVVGECLRNRSFDWWRTSSAPFDWTTIAGTVAKETSTIYERGAALKLTGTGSAGSLNQLIPLEKILEGVTLTLAAWVKGSGTDNATKLRLSIGSTNNDSPDTGTSTSWQKLTATGAIADRYQPVTATVINTSNGASYFDALTLYVPTGHRVTWLPFSDFIGVLKAVERGPRSDVTGTITEDWTSHPMPDRIADGYAWFTGARERVYPYPELINQRAAGTLPNPYWIRLTGEGRYPTVSATTDSVELSEETAVLVAMEAALILLRKAKGYELTADPAFLKRLEDDILGQKSELLASLAPQPVGIRLPIRRRF